MAKIRRTLHTTPEFKVRLMKLQGKIKSRNGEEPSLTDLTGEILKAPAFEEVEKQVIENMEKQSRVTNRILNIKLDGRI